MVQLEASNISSNYTGVVEIAPHVGATIEAPLSLKKSDQATRIRTVPENKLLGLWRFKGALLVVLDAMTISSSFMLAYFFRFIYPSISDDTIVAPEILNYVQGAALLTLFWVFLIWRDGGYKNGLIIGQESLFHKMRIIFTAGMYALGCLMVISFLFRDLLLSRQVYIMTSVMSLGVLIVLRHLFRSIDRDLASQGMVANRVLITGLNEQSVDFASRLNQTTSLCHVLGLASLDNKETIPDHFADIPVIGDLNEIEEIYNNCNFEILVLPNAMKSNGQGFMEVLNFCESKNIKVYSLPNNFNIAVDQQEVGSFNGIPIMLMRDAAVRPGYAMIKRLMDIIASFLIIVLGSPMWIAAALAIKLNDKGPVFFTQTRSGIHGDPFKMYKFRSMTVDAEKQLESLVDLDKLDEPVFKIKNDPRVTLIGRILRRTSLDEIPQLINVLKGEMSLVGPRPEEMSVVARYTPWQRRRLKAVPGITGHQQIHNRGEASLSKRIQYDLIYIKHQGLFLDLFILLKTIKVVIFGSGVTH